MVKIQAKSLIENLIEANEWAIRTKGYRGFLPEGMEYKIAVEQSHIQNDPSLMPVISYEEFTLKWSNFHNDFIIELNSPE